MPKDEQYLKKSNKHYSKHSRYREDSSSSSRRHSRNHHSNHAHYAPSTYRGKHSKHKYRHYKTINIENTVSPSGQSSYRKIICEAKQVSSPGSPSSPLPPHPSRSPPSPPVPISQPNSLPEKTEIATQTDTEPKIADLAKMFSEFRSQMEEIQMRVLKEICEIKESLQEKNDDKTKEILEDDWDRTNETADFMDNIGCRSPSFGNEDVVSADEAEIDGLQSLDRNDEEIRLENEETWFSAPLIFEEVEVKKREKKEKRKKSIEREERKREEKRRVEWKGRGKGKKDDDYVDREDIKILKSGKTKDSWRKRQSFVNVNKEEYNNRMTKI